MSSKMMKRSSLDNQSPDQASLESAQKRRAVHQKVECNNVVDEVDDFPKKVTSQPEIEEDEVQSQNESNNLPENSIQTLDYWDSSSCLNDNRAERLVIVPEFTFDPIKLRRELARMIIMHEYPLSVIDHLGFKDFLKILNPLFGMVSQKTVESDILKVFRFEKSIAYGELGGFYCGRVAITTKLWISSDGNQRFLAITGHIIDGEWKKQSYIMRFANVPLPCTNESLSKIILDSFSDFGVQKNLSTITVDSYTSDDELHDILVDKLSGNKFIVNCKLFRLPCFARTLSLMVQDGFDVIGHVIKKIRASIMFWIASPERENTFEKATCELGVSPTTKLVLDDGFTWSSTYFMLQGSIIFKDVFSYLGKQESCPSKEEWDLTKEVCNRLKWFYEFIENLRDAPACMFFIYMCHVKVKLSEWLNCEILGIKEMASKMVEKFDKYWFAARDILGVATAFHPKHRFSTLKYFFPKIYGNGAEGEIERIHQMFKDSFLEYKRSLPVDEINDEELRSSMSSIYYDFIMEEREEEKKTPLREVDSYLKTYHGPTPKNSEILSWWKDHEIMYPVLYKMAKDILPIRIFSVDVENAFDIGDRVLGANRSRLHPTMVEALMCTQSLARNWKCSHSTVSSAASNLHSLGTIHDDANIERGVFLKAKSAEEGDEPLKSQQ